VHLATRSRFFQTAGDRQPYQNFQVIIALFAAWSVAGERETLLVLYLSPVGYLY
jgi:hypothetical protein